MAWHGSVNVSSACACRYRSFGWVSGTSNTPPATFQFMPGGDLGCSASDIDDGVATDNAKGQIGVPDRRQSGDRTHGRPACLDIH